MSAARAFWRDVACSSIMRRWVAAWLSGIACGIAWQDFWLDAPGDGWAFVVEGASLAALALTWLAVRALRRELREQRETRERFARAVHVLESLIGAQVTAELREHGFSVTVEHNDAEGE